tara:strand:- start:9677 stop:11452 length:1776 start_codon:yes stop_codon:yes gene_type:complete
MKLRNTLLLAVTLTTLYLPSNLSAQSQRGIGGFVCSYFKESDGRPGLEITAGEFVGLNQETFTPADKSVTVGIYLPRFDVAGKQTCIYIDTPNKEPIHWHKTVENNSIVHKTFQVQDLIKTYGAGTYSVKFAFDTTELGSYSFKVSENSVVQKVQAFKPPTQSDQSLEDDFDQQFDLMMKSIFPDYQKLLPEYQNNKPSNRQLEEQIARQYHVRLLNNPQIVQKHPYYPAFEKELDEIIHFPNKAGFLNNASRYIAEDLVHNEKIRSEFEQNYYEHIGQRIDLKNPSDSAKAFLFFTWMTIQKIESGIEESLSLKFGKSMPFEEQPGYSKAAFSISKNETQSVFNSVLNQLQKTETFPVAQFTSKNYVGTYPSELAHFRADYSAFLPNKGTGAIPIIASGWKDKDYDRKFSLSEIDGLYKPVFKAGETQYLGGYFNPDMNFKIRIFNPGGEEIESFSGSKTFTVQPGTNGYGVYTVSFSLNGVVWQVRQFRLVPNTEITTRFLQKQGLPVPRRAGPSFIPAQPFAPAPGLVPARPNPDPRNIQEAPAPPKNAPTPKGAPAPRYPAPAPNNFAPAPKAPAPKRAPAPAPKKA